MVAERTEAGVKTNEGPMAAVVLGQIDLDNKIVTADGLHTVKAAHGRTHRCHRSHPMGWTLRGPALHHSRTHIMILERPCRHR